MSINKHKLNTKKCTFRKAYQVIHSAPKRLTSNEVPGTCIACFLGEVGSTWQRRQSDLDYERYEETLVRCACLTENKCQINDLL